MTLHGNQSRHHCKTWQTVGKGCFIPWVRHVHGTWSCHPCTGSTCCASGPAFGVQVQSASTSTCLPAPAPVFTSGCAHLLRQLLCRDGEVKAQVSAHLRTSPRRVRMNNRLPCPVNHALHGAIFRVTSCSLVPCVRSGAFRS